MSAQARVPSWLAEAPKPKPKPKPLNSPIDSGLSKPPAPGEIWVASPLDDVRRGRRHVLVLEVDVELGLVSCAMTSNVTEAATDRDCRFTADELDAEFELIIEADIVGPLWWEQLRSQVARAGAEIAATVLSTGNAGYDRLPDGRRGIPIQGPHDWRSEFKQMELAAMHSLTRDCVAFLSEAESIPVCDPHFLRPDVMDEDDLYTLFTLIANNAAEVPPEIAWRFLEIPDYELQWKDRFGWDAWNALQLFLQVRDIPDHEADTDGLIEPQRTNTDDGELLVEEALRRSQNGRHSFSLVTRPDLWSDHMDRWGSRSCSIQIGDAAVHVLRERVAA